MKTLETKRLILRSWKLSDAADMFEYAKSPNVGPRAGWQPHASMEVSKSIIKNFIKQEDVWAIVLKENNKVIGSIGLHKDCKRSHNKSRMLGYVLSENYWNNGYITEAVKCVINYAFSDLNLNLISIFHYPFNMQSKRVIEKCGFKYEGTLRMAAEIFDGSVYDEVCYSLTKEEWI